jgi:hypothetical protein
VSAATTLVVRDPYARQELHRTRHYVSASTCRWCGGVRTTPKGARFLFAYEVQSDGGRRSMVSGFFCNVGCMRSFHG